MDLMQIRRALMMGNRNGMPKGTLKYWFFGQDAPVNGAWQDRVSNLRFMLYKNNSTSGADSLWNQEQGWYEFYGSIGNYAYLADMNAVNLNLGHHWRLEFDFELNGAQTNSTFLDFGSVETSNKAIGFTFASKNANYSNGRMTFNWKMLGNNSNPGLSVDAPYLISDENIYKSYSGYYAILDGGDGYDRFHRLLNGASDVVQIQVPKVEYGPIWHQKGAYMGRGYLRNNYYSNVRIKDLKIYVID